MAEIPCHAATGSNCHFLICELPPYPPHALTRAATLRLERDLHTAQDLAVVAREGWPARQKPEQKDLRQEQWCTALPSRLLALASGAFCVAFCLFCFVILFPHQTSGVVRFKDGAATHIMRRDPQDRRQYSIEDHRQTPGSTRLYRTQEAGQGGSSGQLHHDVATCNKRAKGAQVGNCAGMCPDTISRPRRRAIVQERGSTQ